MEKTPQFQIHYCSSKFQIPSSELFPSSSSKIKIIKPFQFPFSFSLLQNITISMASPPFSAIFGHRNVTFPWSLLLLLLPPLLLSPSLTFASPCRTSCGNIPIKYPFGIDDGCGAPQFRRMFNCSNDLFFLTPSGSYKVQSIDYDEQSMVIYDPAMSTCSILQPHHDFTMTDIQSIIIPPSPDTVFALLNCSIDSPILNHYKYLCFNFSGHSCDELYGSCNAFRVFHLLTNSTSPPCCFTGYDTVKMMSMNILDCTHYTTVLNTENLKGVGALDWEYGMKLSFSVANLGCDRCSKSGGNCGFDTETEGLLCLCSVSSNHTRDCVGGNIPNGGPNQASVLFIGEFIFSILIILHLNFISF
ncbi:uncharacterized protein LOC103483914 [Cucumis melo]|uniref:non-specific serine/threonine protein kinase n=1 Tax=Cucumis melo TaxID=3656 RepID=A0A1S3AYB7_CUCME|nr:uncharacterized protein LOC103483914 [Cucumis melo]